MPKFDIGFWATKADAVYRSEIIDTHSLPDQVRILIRHNRNKRRGDNKPTYIGTLVTASSEKNDQVQLEDVSTLKALIKEANQETSKKKSPEESRSTANDYWKKIITEVEHLAGEEIDIKIWG